MAADGTVVPGVCMDSHGFQVVMLLLSDWALMLEACEHICAVRS